MGGVETDALRVWRGALCFLDEGAPCGKGMECFKNGFRVVFQIPASASLGFFA